MMSQLMLQDVTSQDYQIQCLPSSGSSLGKMDTGEIWGSAFHIWQNWQNLSSLIEADLSSVSPSFEIKSESSLMEFNEISEETIVAEMVEHDFVVRMPPIRKYTLRVKVKSIRKAAPHIVEPEGVL